MSPKDDSKLSNSNSNQITRDGISFQVALLPDPSGQHPWMSGVTMLVRWLFPSTARSGECQHSFFPGLKKMHPSATRRAREPTGCVLLQVREPTGCVFVQGWLKQVCPDGLAVTGFWASNALYLPRQGQSPSCWTFMFHTGPRSESSGIRWGRPAERHKKQRQRQATQPGENSQKDNPSRGDSPNSSRSPS